MSVHRYPEFTQVINVVLRWDPFYKTLRLTRPLDGHRGYFVPMSIDLDHPYGEMVTLLLERWLSVTEPDHERPPT